MRKLCLWVLLLGLMMPLAAQAEQDFAVNRDSLYFIVKNGGSPIGTHRVSIRQEGARTIVQVRINLRVQLAFITLYRYDHENTEVWEDNQLISISSDTDDDGTQHRVRGQRLENGFAISASDRADYVAPLDVVTTSYWNINSLLSGRPVLDTQSGEVRTLKVAPVDAALLGAAAKADAQRWYRVQGDDLDFNIAYDNNNRWVDLAFRAKGADIRYHADEYINLP